RQTHCGPTSAKSPFAVHGGKVPISKQIVEVMLMRSLQSRELLAALSTYNFLLILDEGRVVICKVMVLPKKDKTETCKRNDEHAEFHDIRLSLVDSSKIRQLEIWPSRYRRGHEILTARINTRAARSVTRTVR